MEGSFKMPLSLAAGIHIDQNFTWLGQAAQAGGQIEGITGHTMRAPIQVHLTGHNQTGVDPGVHGDGLTSFFLNLGTK